MCSSVPTHGQLEAKLDVILAELTQKEKPEEGNSGLNPLGWFQKKETVDQAPKKEVNSEIPMERLISLAQSELKKCVDNI